MKTSVRRVYGKIWTRLEIKEREAYGIYMSEAQETGFASRSDEGEGEGGDNQRQEKNYVT